MSVECGFFQGIQTICARHPECDFFTGRTHIVWPHESIPGWARNYSVQCWAHSVNDFGEEDHSFQPGEWPSPNLFWIRRRVLDDGRRFDEGVAARYHTSDIDFLLRLAEDGYCGVAGPEVVVGHRVQPELLQLDVLRSRAIRLGRALPLVRLNKPKTVRQAQIYQRHPVLWRPLCAANLARWTLSYLRGALCRDADVRAVRQLVALFGMANNYEALLYRRS